MKMELIRAIVKIVDALEDTHYTLDPIEPKEMAKHFEGGESHTIFLKNHNTSKGVKIDITLQAEGK